MDFICSAVFLQLDSNMPLCYSAIPSRSLRRDGADLKGFGNSQQAFCRAKFAFAQRSNESPSGAFKRQNGLRQQMEGLRPDKFRHDAQNADNARKNTAFPPVCKKCAKVCKSVQSPGKWKIPRGILRFFVGFWCARGNSNPWPSD